MKVKTKISEKGPELMTATGHHWIGNDGKVLKITAELSDWPIPLAGRALSAEILAKLID